VNHWDNDQRGRNGNCGRGVVVQRYPAVVNEKFFQGLNDDVPQLGFFWGGAMSAPAMVFLRNPVICRLGRRGASRQ